MPFAIEDKGTFDSPWSLAFAPGTQVLFITEKPGTMKFVDLASGRLGTVTGAPQVAFGGQGGSATVAFLPSESSANSGRRTIYLSWAEQGEGSTRNAALGRGTLVCEEADACRIDGLQVIWRQSPKVASPGHFSHRIEFSPDGKYLFLGSGERMQVSPRKGSTTISAKSCASTSTAPRPTATRSPIAAACRARSGATATATLRACSSTSTASCGTSSTGRAVATRSTRSSRATTMAGRSVPTATITMAT